MKFVLRDLCDEQPNNAHQFPCCLCAACPPHPHHHGSQAKFLDRGVAKLNPFAVIDVRIAAILPSKDVGRHRKKRG